MKTFINVIGITFIVGLLLYMATNHVHQLQERAEAQHQAAVDSCVARLTPPPYVPPPGLKFDWSSFVPIEPGGRTTADDIHDTCIAKVGDTPSIFWSKGTK